MLKWFSNTVKNICSMFVASASGNPYFFISWQSRLSVSSKKHVCFKKIDSGQSWRRLSWGCGSGFKELLNTRQDSAKQGWEDSAALVINLVHERRSRKFMWVFQKLLSLTSLSFSDNLRCNSCLKHLLSGTWHSHVDCPVMSTRLGIWEMR